MRLLSLKFFFSLMLCYCQYAAAQYTIPQKPAVLYPVYDEAGLLMPEEKQRLNDKLIKFADSASTEIEVVIIPSTKGEDVNFLATMFGEKWGIGKKDQDNGIVFLIATEDHTMSIQQGRAVEPYLTASVAGQILDYIVTPNFRKARWYEGIDRGTTALMEAVQGKFKPEAQKPRDEISIFKVIIIVIVVLIILSFLFGNRGGGDGGDGDTTLSRRGRRNYPGGFFPFPGSFGGGGGFGGGSGGFGGFGGGGSFGGGGASGGW